MKGESIKWISLIFLFVIGLSIGNITYATPSTLVYVDPAENVANPCEYFDINITVMDVVDMYSWALKVGFNRYVLEVTSATEGPFLKDQVGSTFFIAKIYPEYVDLACSTLGLVPGASGSGVLVTITFHVKDLGECVLDVYDDILLDSTLTEIAHDTADGYFCYDHTTITADLVRKSAWPYKHHFVISKHGEYQTLYGKVRNLAPMNLYLKVVFEIVRDDGDVKTVETGASLIAPDAIMDLTGAFGPLAGEDAGRYHVSASCWYSYSGDYWAQGEKIKAFSFAVVP